MKKQDVKKLRLAKETVRMLAGAELGEVAAGTDWTHWSLACQTSNGPCACICHDSDYC